MFFLLLFGALTWDAANSLRVDDKMGFRYCNEPQLATVERVEVTSCLSWPCVIIPGRSGAFKVLFTHNAGRGLMYLESSVHAYVNVEGIANLTGRKKVALPGEVNVPACPFVNNGCPVPPGRQILFTKVLQVPHQARQAESMIVELRVTTGSGETLTCFRAPVLL